MLYWQALGSVEMIVFTFPALDFTSSNRIIAAIILIFLGLLVYILPYTSFQVSCTRDVDDVLKWDLGNLSLITHKLTAGVRGNQTGCQTGTCILRNCPVHHAVVLLRFGFGPSGIFSSFSHRSFMDNLQEQLESWISSWQIILYRGVPLLSMFHGYLEVPNPP